MKENEDLSIPFGEREIEEVNNKIKENSKDIIKMLKNKDFLKIIRELVNENAEKFQIAFAEPYDEDFINIVIFDLYIKKIISKGELNNLKKFYSNENISINFES